MFQDISKRIDGYSDFIIDLQKKLIATPSIGPENGGEGEYKKSLILERVLKDIFDEVKVIKVKDERVPNGYRPNIVAKMYGKDTSKTIWMMTHMDVVPAGDEKLWHTNPFEAVVKGGKIYGRGAEDNHQGTISTILAAQALKEASVKPSCTFGVIMAADEEVNSDFGVKYLIKNHRDLFGKDDSIIVPDEGNGEGTEIEISEKSVLWYKVKIIGKQTHGSQPERGINTLKAAAHLICKVESFYKKYNRKNTLFEPPISTFEPTKIEANVDNINTISGEDTVYFDCRLLPEEDVHKFNKRIEAFFKEIEKEFGVNISYETVSFDIAPPATPVDSPLIKKLLYAIEKTRNIKPHFIGIGGQTVASHFRNAGMHCAVYSKLLQTMHKPDEYCIIENLIGDAKIWAHIFTE